MNKVVRIKDAYGQRIVRLFYFQTPLTPRSIFLKLSLAFPANSRHIMAIANHFKTSTKVENLNYLGNLDISNSS